MNLPYKYIAGAALLLCACNYAGPDSPRPTTTRQIMPWTQDSAYWSWNGTEPVLLLGAGGDAQAFLDPDREHKLKLLTDNGGNYALLELDLVRYQNDRSDFNEGWLDSLRHYLAAADENDVVVQVDFNLPPATGDFGPIDPGAGPEIFRRYVRMLTPFGNVVVHTRTSRESAEALGPYDRILTEETKERVSPLPLAGRNYYQSGFRLNPSAASDHWMELNIRRALLGSYDNLPWNYPRIVNHGEVAAAGITAFNRCLIAGAAAVRHAPQPAGDGFTGPGLSSLRAVRTVERMIPFWELNPAPSILAAGTDERVLAATNGNSSFLVYLPTAMAVELRLGVRPQVPLRVTVVGYLGTRRSEVLRPPYGDSFTLFTEEARGGWLVIEPAGQ